jgi:hypothetical protein
MIFFSYCILKIELLTYYMIFWLNIRVRHLGKKFNLNLTHRCAQGEKGAPHEPVITIVKSIGNKNAIKHNLWDPPRFVSEPQL